MGSESALQANQGGGFDVKVERRRRFCNVDHSTVITAVLTAVVQGTAL